MQNEQEFADLYKAYRARVMSLCRYLLNSADGAEDATHEVFLRAQRAIGTYDPGFPFSSWILGIASHYCVDILRRRSTESRLFGLDENDRYEPPDRGPSPLSAVLAAERARDIRAALGELPEKYRVPLVMAYYNEWSYDQIADALSLSRNHVASLLFRGKYQLRQMLAHLGAEGAKR